MPRDSVVRKPAVAGPKPTQAMSTSTEARSGAGWIGSAMERSWHVYRG
ncbi:MAG: hypothetical protein WB974_21150 [Acidobacteriaceae bacterium]